MKERKIALIACKVLSVYVVVQGIIHISNFITLSLIPLLDQSLNISFRSQIILVSLLPSSVLLILGIVLWIKADIISKFIVLQEDNLDNTKTLNMEELHRIALSIVGIVIVVSVVPAFIREIPNILQIKNELLPSNSIARVRIICSIAEKFVRLVLGLLLVLRPKGIIGIIKSLQRAGLEHTE